MISFIKAAIREIDHVVWPTEKDTRKYFSIVTSMIVIATIVLFAFGTLVSAGMFAIRSVTPHDVKPVVETQTEDILKNLPKTKAKASGSGATSTGTAVVSGTATPNK